MFRTGTRYRMFRNDYGILVFFTSVLCMGKTNEDVKIGVILPMTMSTQELWILPKTRPAIAIAVEKVEAMENLLRGRKILVTYEDSKCDETEGPLKAIDMYVKKSAHVFLGPACEYAVAPVARFSYSWNIPVISAGALVDAFEDKSEYKLLTRIMGSYAKLGHFVRRTLQEFNWSSVGLVYQDKHGANAGRSPCYFALEAIFNALKIGKYEKPWHASFQEKNPKLGHGDILQRASKNTRRNKANVDIFTIISLNLSKVEHLFGYVPKLDLSLTVTFSMKTNFKFNVSDKTND